MKKSLIALAVVGAFSAPAFADTNTFYGLVDGALANVSMTGQKSQTLAVSGGLATSRLGFKGSEDLGDGLKAIYTLEYALDIEQNGPVGTAPSIANSTTTARQQLVGLSGSFGTVATGRLQTTGYDFEVKYDPLGGSLVSPIQNLNSAKQFLIGTTAQAARASRAFAYTTPNLSGFTVSVDFLTLPLMPISPRPWLVPTTTKAQSPLVWCMQRQALLRKPLLVVLITRKNGHWAVLMTLA